MCDALCKAGKKKKDSKNRGRPSQYQGSDISGITGKETGKTGKLESETHGSTNLTAAVKQRAGKKMRRFIPLQRQRFNDLIEEMECPICKDIIDGPIQLLCDGPNVFCAECLCQWLQVSSSCPVPSLYRVYYV